MSGYLVFGWSTLAFANSVVRIHCICMSGVHELGVLILLMLCTHVLRTANYRCYAVHNLDPLR
jgi:hypothetical protein